MLLSKYKNIWKDSFKIKNMKIEPFSGEEFAPRIGLAERYSLEYQAKKLGVTVDELKIQVQQEIQIKEDEVKRWLDKGCTPEQAETMAMRCLYIPGFSGPTFKD